MIKIYKYYIIKNAKLILMYIDKLLVFLHLIQIQFVDN